MSFLLLFILQLLSNSKLFKKTAYEAGCVQFFAPILKFLQVESI